MAQIEWRNLVDVVVEPVGEQQVAVATPVARRQFRVVLREVVERHLRVQAGLVVPMVLTRQRESVIFRMAGNKGRRLSLLAIR